MMACRYANIEKYLHGIAFKRGSHMPWGQGPKSRSEGQANLPKRLKSLDCQRSPDRRTDDRFCRAI